MNILMMLSPRRDNESQKIADIRIEREQERSLREEMRDYLGSKENREEEKARKYGLYRHIKIICIGISRSMYKCNDSNDGFIR
jgi:hypothetical protein